MLLILVGVEGGAAAHGFRLTREESADGQENGCAAHCGKLALPGATSVALYYTVMAKSYRNFLEEI